MEDDLQVNYVKLYIWAIYVSAAWYCLEMFFGKNPWISISKWIRNEDSKFNIKYKAEQTLKFSFANPPVLAA